MRESEVLLETADRLLKDVVPGTRGLWPRAVALVARAALEVELDGYWAQVQPEVAAAPTRSQLLLLPSYAGADVARDAVDAWYSLSRGSHHHAYELAPTAQELRDWVGMVQRVEAALSTTPSPSTADAAGDARPILGAHAEGHGLGIGP